MIAKPRRGIFDERRGKVAPIVLQLAQARVDANLGQAEVAEQVRVHKVSISHWESGVYQPRILELYRWADALGFKIILVSKDQP